MMVMHRLKKIKAHCLLKKEAKDYIPSSFFSPQIINGILTIFQL